MNFIYVKSLKVRLLTSMVREKRFELSQIYIHYPLKVARLPFRHSRKTIKKIPQKRKFSYYKWCDKRAYFELLHKSRLININYNIILTSYRLDYNTIFEILLLSFDFTIYTIRT